MPLGNGKVCSRGRMTLFTARLGILRLETPRGGGNIFFYFMRLSGAFSFECISFGAIYILS